MPDVPEHENHDHLLKIPLYRYGSEEEPRTPGYEKELRPRAIVLKCFLKLIGRHEKLKAQYQAAFDKQMFGQPNEYIPGDWVRINELEAQVLRMEGAIAGLRWALDMADSIGLDIEAVMMIDTTKLDRPDE